MQQEIRAVFIVLFLLLVGCVAAYFISQHPMLTEFGTEERVADGKNTAEEENPPAIPLPSRVMETDSEDVRQPKSPNGVVTSVRVETRSEAVGPYVDREAEAELLPDTSKVQIGATRSSLRAAYGEPTLKITSMDEGRAVEKYVYIDMDSDTTTITRLENGRLVAVETTPR